MGAEGVMTAWCRSIERPLRKGETYCDGCGIVVRMKRAVPHSLTAECFVTQELQRMASFGLVQAGWCLSVMRELGVEVHRAAITTQLVSRHDPEAEPYAKLYDWEQVRVPAYGWWAEARYVHATELLVQVRMRGGTAERAWWVRQILEHQTLERAVKTARQFDGPRAVRATLDAWKDPDVDTA